MGRKDAKEIHEDTVVVTPHLPMKLEKQPKPIRVSQLEHRIAEEKERKNHWRKVLEHWKEKVQAKFCLEVDVDWASLETKLDEVISSSTSQGFVDLRGQFFSGHLDSSDFTALRVLVQRQYLLVIGKVLHKKASEVFAKLEPTDLVARQKLVDDSYRTIKGCLEVPGNDDELVKSCGSFMDPLRWKTNALTLKVDASDRSAIEAFLYKTAIEAQAASLQRAKITVEAVTRRVFRLGHSKEKILSKGVLRPRAQPSCLSNEPVKAKKAPKT